MFEPEMDPKFGWADYLVLGVILCVSASIGIFYAIRGRRQTTANDFIVASRQIGFLPVAMSLLASLFTGVFIQGTSAEVYFRGLYISAGSLVALPIAGYIAGTIFLPAFYKMRLRSVFQYLDMRFNKIVRNMCLSVGFVYLIFHGGIATFAACLVLTTVSNMSFFVATIVLSGVCTFYTALGGIKAVVWADAFQMVLMYSPLVAAVVVSSAKLGFANVWETGANGGRLDIWNFSPDPTEYLNFWSAFVGSIFSWIPSMCVIQYQVQRYNTCKSPKTANIAMTLFVLGCEIVVVLCALAGLSIYAMFIDCDPLKSGQIVFRDQLLPHFVLQSFYHLPGLPGLLVSGLCSAALSTVSSIINSAVTLTGEHFITKVWKNMPDATYLLITKLLAVFFGCVNIGMTYFVSTLGDILPTIAGLIGATRGPVVGVFILGFIFPKCNSKGAIAGFTVSLALGLWLFIGATVYRTPIADLPLSIEGCPSELTTSVVTSNMTLPGTSGVTPGLDGLVSPSDSFVHLSNTARQYISDVTSGVNSTASPEPEKPFVLYRITRWWYPAITICTSVLVALVVSFVTGFNDPTSMDEVLFVNWYSVFCWCRSKQEPEEEDFKTPDSQDSNNTVMTATGKVEIENTEDCQNNITQDTAL